MVPQVPDKPRVLNLLRAADNAVMSPPGRPAKAPGQGGLNVGKPTPEKRRADRQVSAGLAEELAAIVGLTTAQLAAKFMEVTGRKPRSRNRQWLRKRVAWHMQAAVHGGLSDAAKARLEELMPIADEMWRRGSLKPLSAPRADRHANAPAKAVIAGPVRDARLPEPGTVLTRHYGGIDHEVTVLADGFDFRGARHRSLSRVAREITGTPWNGFSFFGLSEPARSAAARGAS